MKIKLCFFLIWGLEGKRLVAVAAWISSRGLSLDLANYVPQPCTSQKSTRVLLREVPPGLGGVRLTCLKTDQITWDFK